LPIYPQEPFALAMSYSQGRNEVRWRPAKEASLASPRSNLRSFGSICSVLTTVLVILLGLFGALRSHSAAPIVIQQRPGNCAPLPPVRYASAYSRLPSWNRDGKVFFRLLSSWIN